jgi:glycosyltransferase involved in cell wall biosynthesis
MTRLRLALIRFDNKEIVSIERTAAVYVTAFSANYDVTHVHDPRSVSDWTRFDLAVDFMHYFIEADFRPPIPIIYCLHGTAARGMVPYRQHGHKLRSWDRFIVNCTSDKQIIEFLFPVNGPKASVLPLPVDDRIFFPLNKSECKRKLGLQNNFVLGFVGRLYPQKNLHRFLSIAAAIRTQVPNIECVVIGDYCLYTYFDWYSDKAYASYITSLIRRLGLEEQVTFVQTFPSDAVLNEYYNAMDILFHPTNVLDENYGYVPREAAACGVPVIGNAWGGLKDMNTTGTDNLLLPTYLTQTGLRSHYFEAAAHAVRLLEKSRENNFDRAAVTSPGDFSRAVRTIVDDVFQSSRFGDPGAAPMFRTLDGEGALPFPVHEAAWLPEYMHNWTSLAHFSSFYASSQIPKLELTDQPVVAGALSPDEKGNLILDDPSWPAHYNINNALELLDQCNGHNSIEIICRKSGRSREDGLTLIQTLCEMGIITVERRFI